MRTLSELLKEHNISGLRTLRIAENKMMDEPDVIGYAFEDGEWIIYMVGSRGYKTVAERLATEEEAINKVFALIKAYYNMGR